MTEPLASRVSGGQATLTPPRARERRQAERRETLRETERRLREQAGVPFPVEPPPLHDVEPEHPPTSFWRIAFEYFLMLSVYLIPLAVVLWLLLWDKGTAPG
ncbi:MAG: hypothetical protein AB7N76_30940 [Planctomycetota bacterium]